VERVQIALRLKDVPFVERYVSLVEKPEWFLALAPGAKVPVLIVDGKPVAESSAIVELLDELFPAPPFFPPTPIARGEVRAAIRWLDGEVFPALYTLVRRVVQYEQRSDGGSRYRFENGRVFLRRRDEIEGGVARDALTRLTDVIARFAGLVDAMDPAAAASLALAVSFQPLVHNPDFRLFDDPESPLDVPAPWTTEPALASLVDAARALPTDHIRWMYT
jgi:glutathione S-transferase